MEFFDLNKYSQLVRQGAEEGVVLLRNERQLLPLHTGVTLSVFGRSQLHYYKSGTGSGGMVNTDPVVGILEALIEEESFSVNPILCEKYRTWGQEHPFVKGRGWGQEPWFQEEMPLTAKEVEDAAKISDIAIVLIGRTSGEDKDNSYIEGSLYLTKQELDNLRIITKYFEKSIVILNTGNVIDMQWIDECNPSVVMYAWQGGQEGGRAVVNILTGRTTPSGKLTDTIPLVIEDNPSTKNFGDKQRSVYEEDIYVGYRYFETFAKEKVRYPFGFGLSYTSFVLDTVLKQGEILQFETVITNTGTFSGKEVVQIYVEAPQGMLGKPARALCGFAKTRILAPGENDKIVLCIDKSKLASYDDSGLSGHPFAYVLEAGVYRFYVGTDVRSAAFVGSFNQENTEVVQQLQQAAAPVEAFDRIRPVAQSDRSFAVGYEPTPLRQYDLQERIASKRLTGKVVVKDNGWKLRDVAQGTVNMDEFLKQIPEEQLCIMVRGEGLCSPKVTPGTAAAFGGISPELQAFGIPAGCCTDGPSGLRMDCGTKAFSLPNGTCLASSFNEQICQDIYEMLGMEMRKNCVDILLGPGMNLHRSPMNGRNFEYYSEDPLVTGKIAAAQIRGLHRYRVTGAIKHFACNNQELGRRSINCIVSERALRELYLKSFEIVVKEAQADCLMSSYNAVNGIWAAGNFDLLTTILREEWGFNGLVMSDWHAIANEEGCPPSAKEVAPMIRSQNDLYMVVNDALSNSGEDNLEEALADGRLTHAELIRSAKSICRILMNGPVFDRFLGKAETIEFPADETTVQLEDLQMIVLDENGSIPIEDLSTERSASHVMQIFLRSRKTTNLTFEIRADAPSDLAQLPLLITKNGEKPVSVFLWGSDREWRTVTIDLGAFFADSFYLKFYFGESGLELRNCRLE